MPAQHVIEIQNLIHRYPGNDDYALRDLTFNTKNGEIFGLLGPNGAGKTTTISILSGLLKHNSGIVRILNLDPSAENLQIKKLTGIVPQEIALFSLLSVEDNLLIFGTLYGLEKQVLKKQIAQRLEVFGLTAKRKAEVKSLSGGMKRRLHIIAGILHNPKLLILDEPTAGIDVQSKNMILDYLKQLNSEGMTILYTSHDMDEAEKFCTKTAIIDQGKIIALDTPQNLIQQHDNCADFEDVFLHLTGRKIRD